MDEGRQPCLWLDEEVEDLREGNLAISLQGGNMLAQKSGAVRCNSIRVFFGTDFAL